MDVNIDPVLFCCQPWNSDLACRGAVLSYAKYFPTIGMRRPMPKALEDTRSTGAV